MTYMKCEICVGTSKMMLNMICRQSLLIIKAAKHTRVDRQGKMFHQTCWILIMNIFHTQSDLIWFI